MFVLFYFQRHIWARCLGHPLRWQSLWGRRGAPGPPPPRPAPASLPRDGGGGAVRRDGAGGDDDHPLGHLNILN